MEQEEVIIGNDGLMACKVPSFVADLVAIDGWVDSQGTGYPARPAYGNFD